LASDVKPFEAEKPSQIKKDDDIHESPMIDIQMMHVIDEPTAKPVEKISLKPGEEPQGSEKKGFIKTVMGYFRKEQTSEPKAEVEAGVASSN
jgi:hypothetical protein